MVIGYRMVIVALGAVLLFSGCDRKRQERVAQTERLETITRRLDEIQANIAVAAERPTVYAPAPTYAPSNSGVFLNPDGDSMVQITDFTGVEPTTRKAQVARLGQSNPSARSAAPAKKTPAKGNTYAKTIVVSGLSATDVQKALKNAGYDPGKIDGKPGPRTVAAIKQFQKVEGLTADGVVGRRTWEKLSPYLAGGVPAGSSTATPAAPDALTFF